MSVSELVMNSGGIDRISDLHDSILWHIVSLLPTKYAVRSSILSTRWKLVWTCITKLDFLDNNEGRYGEADAEDEEGRYKFTQFVNRVLLLRRNNPTPVHEFLLECSILKFDQSQLNSWICQSIQLAVKKLVVCIRYIDNPPISLPPPSSWIHSNTLVVLMLIGEMCFINIPEFSSISFPSLHTLNLCMITYALTRNGSVEFPKLKRLNLFGVLYKSEDSLYKLLKSCPVLEQLYIIRCRWDNIPNLVISKPTLTDLVINITECFEVPPRVDECWRAKLDAPQLQCLTFVDSSWRRSCFSVETSAFNSLTKATFKILMLYPEDRFDTNYRNALFKLIKTLPASNLEHLLLVDGTMKVLCSELENNITAPMFRNLATLDLDVSICFNRHAITVIKSLIEHMDNLQILLLGHYESCGKLNESQWNDVPSLFEPKGLFPRLRQVKAASIHGCTHEFKLLRYILRNAEHLELMTLDVSPLRDSNISQLLQNISLFPRRSPTCRLQVKHRF